MEQPQPEGTFPSLLKINIHKLEYLQNHLSEQIYRLAYRIIEKFFSDEDEVDLHEC